MLAIEDVGVMRHLVSTMKFWWFKGAPWLERADAVSIDEVIECFLSSLGTMNIDEFDFVLGCADPRIVKKMQVMIDEKAKAATK